MLWNDCSIKITRSPRIDFSIVVMLAQDSLIAGDANRPWKNIKTLNYTYTLKVCANNIKPVKAEVEHNLVEVVRNDTKKTMNEKRRMQKLDS